MEPGMDDLEKTLEKTEEWFYSRLNDNYGQEFSEGIRKEALATVSHGLKEEDRQEIADFFGRNNLLESIPSYFTLQYVMGKMLLHEIEESDDKPAEEDQKVLDKVVGPHSRLVRFIEGLYKIPDLDSRKIEQGFTGIYESAQGFSSDFCALLGMALCENKRDPKRKSVSDEISDYTTIQSNENIRIVQRFMPKVFNRVLGDMYKTDQKQE